MEDAILLQLIQNCISINLHLRLDENTDFKRNTNKIDDDDDDGKTSISIYNIIM